MENSHCVKVTEATSWPTVGRCGHTICSRCHMKVLYVPVNSGTWQPCPVRGCTHACSFEMQAQRNCSTMEAVNKANQVIQYHRVEALTAGQKAQRKYLEEKAQYSATLAHKNQEIRDLKKKLLEKEQNEEICRNPFGVPSTSTQSTQLKESHKEAMLAQTWNTEESESSTEEDCKVSNKSDKNSDLLSHQSWCKLDIKKRPKTSPNRRNASGRGMRTSGRGKRIKKVSLEGDGAPKSNFLELSSSDSSLDYNYKSTSEEEFV